MSFTFDDAGSIVMIIGSILNWIILFGLIYTLLRMGKWSVKWWKALLVTVFGLFSFSFAYPIMGHTVKLALLPLGVWVLYFFLRKRSWSKYRPYAWGGFASNYVFLLLFLLLVLIDGWVYPKSKPTTYIANVQHAQLIMTHPSAALASFNIAQFKSQLDHLTPSVKEGDIWYYQTVMYTEPNYQKEKFPYTLLGVEAKWGSNLNPIIYIENDGQGMLITASRYQVYVRSEQPLIEVEAAHE